ncbi:MAG: hypothetical protein R3325_04180 [Thermoanaerobaculia bacterium]|nr:hypothetical protein [Thermoanaerobaculia bacterium]
MSSQPAQNIRPPRVYAQKLHTVPLAIYLILLGALLLITVFCVWPEGAPDGGSAGSGAATEAAASPEPSAGSPGPDGSEGAGSTAAAGESQSGSSGVSSTAAAADSGTTTLALTYIPGVLEWTLEVSWEQHLLLIVILLGAVGSWFHAASSFVAFVGNRTFVTSWTLWYLVRPLVGSALAVIFYLVLRGGLLTANAGSESLSYFGIAAISGLVGLFTHKAATKLSEVFDTLFRTTSEEADPLGAEAKLRAKPRVVPVGSEAQTVELEADGLSQSTVVRVQGERRQAKPLEAGRLQITLSGADLATAGALKVTTEAPAGETAVEVREVPAGAGGGGGGGGGGQAAAAEGGKSGGKSGSG